MLFLFFNFHLEQKEEKMKLEKDAFILNFVFDITYVVVQFYPWFKFYFLRPSKWGGVRGYIYATGQIYIQVKIF